MRIQSVIFGFLLLFISVSCENYNKVLKSTDVDYKLEKAKEYYNTGDYYKAKELFSQLIELYRNDPKLEDIYYFYCYCFYAQDEYQQAAYNFKNFTTYFPNSERVDECQYQIAESYEQISPKTSLDQNFTEKAIQSYNLYLKKFPKGEYRDQTIDAIDRLQLKLETKAFNSAKLYFNTENYKSAVVSFSYVNETFPNSSVSDEAAYFEALSWVRYAEKSVLNSQQQRFESAAKAITDYKKEYPEGLFLSEIQDLEKRIKDKL